MQPSIFKIFINFEKHDIIFDDPFILNILVLRKLAKIKNRFFNLYTYTVFIFVLNLES